MPRVLSPKTDDNQYNVRAFGAKGDGSTDDTTALNACLQKVYDDGGGTIVVPPGSYKTSAPLIIRSNTTLICDNGVTFFRSASGSLIMNGDYDEDQSVYTGHGNIRIVGGVWDMKGTTVTNANIGLAFGHGNNISIEGVTVKDVPQNHAIEINSSQTVRIRDCKFLGYKANDGGTVTYNEAIQIDLALTGGGTFGAFGLYDDTPCDDVIVTGCYFGASGTGGTTAWYRGVGSHSGKAGFEHTNIRITDNHFDGLLAEAVNLYGYRRTVVADNVFDGCGTMLYAEGTNSSQNFGNISVTGNVAKSCTKNAAVISISPGTGGVASGIVVSGNTIDGSTGSSAHGIDMSASTYVNVTGNTIANVGGAGVRFVGSCNDVSVTNNIISETTGIGIQVTNATNCVVSGNLLRNIGTEGIYSTGSTDVSYDNNNIKGAGRAANVTHYGIRLTSTCVGYRITNNRIRKYGSGNEVLKGISVTGTCTGGFTRNNDIQDTGYDDAGITRATSLPVGYATVATSETRTSTSYGDLTTVGPAVTINTGNAALVLFSANMVHSVAGSWACMSVEVSGATTISASDNYGLFWRAPVAAYGVQFSNACVITGLTPGSNTFTAKYKSITTGSTSTYSRRNMMVIPLDI